MALNLTDFFRKQMASMFAASGTLHFVAPQVFDEIVPPQLPGERRTYTLASGLAELACAALVALPRTRALGGYASALLLAGVFPANLYMAYLWRKKPLPMQAVALARLPLQVPMISGALDIARGR
ncbi:MauE/DoxX family redox-associated membrane protein [Corynebacterium sp. CCUG 70398]|uniref:DoxX family protein n=1 Tax=Corynebacterium sp. CCUG 70398 TaxID=2823891 RepID=UPI0021089DDB|nr:MauE/DoxX family redox-associated membrane protein [Corynebacterium sp. CCUG 70398]MCQ4622306.1 hypothetical protein [Corynebacterium sp. CCUG 70398]